MRFILQKSHEETRCGRTLNEQSGPPELADLELKGAISLNQLPARPKQRVDYNKKQHI